MSDETHGHAQGQPEMPNVSPGAPFPIVGAGGTMLERSGNDNLILSAPSTEDPTSSNAVSENYSFANQTLRDAVWNAIKNQQVGTTNQWTSIPELVWVINGNQGLLSVSVGVTSDPPQRHWGSMTGPSGNPSGPGFSVSGTTATVTMTGYFDSNHHAHAYSIPTGQATVLTKMAGLYSGWTAAGGAQGDFLVGMRLIPSGYWGAKDSDQGANSGWWGYENADLKLTLGLNVST